MLSSLATYFTRNHIGADNTKRRGQFSNWEKIRKVALILDNSISITKPEIDRFINTLQKETDVYFIETKSKVPSYSEWTCLTKKEKSFLGLPNDALLAELKKKKYDLVINAAFGNTLYASNIASSLQSDFKCGAVNLYGELDLIIDKSSSQNLIQYLNEVKRYLEMIRTE